jgi:hypothetical protein
MLQVPITVGKMQRGNSAAAETRPSIPGNERGRIRRIVRQPAAALSLHATCRYGGVFVITFDVGFGTCLPNPRAPSPYVQDPTEPSLRNVNRASMNQWQELTTSVLLQISDVHLVNLSSHSLTTNLYHC